MPSEKNKSISNQEPQKSQKTSVDDLRRLLDLRFEEELYTKTQGPSDVLEEMVLEPLSHVVKFPLFFQRFVSRYKESGMAGRRVPSVREGAAPPSNATFPPLTIRGVTNRHKPNPPIQEIN